MPLCTFCQKEILTPKPGRLETCLFCQGDLHCCLQCHFYDSQSYNECSEPQAERVLEKEKANFCDYFVFDPQTRIKKESADNSKEKLEALFKKK